jgi:hypothetical protein
MIGNNESRVFVAHRTWRFECSTSWGQAIRLLVERIDERAKISEMGGTGKKTTTNNNRLID